MTFNCYNKSMKRKKYTIKELSELTGISRRTIRFYIQEGILEPPAGRGRGGFYFDSHLKKIEEIRRLRFSGMGLESIRRYFAEREKDSEKTGSLLELKREVWVEYMVIDGIKICINRRYEKDYKKKIIELLKITEQLFNSDFGKND